ncbi:MAG: ABC transporter ATP-binding protein YtrB [Planctomycetota bacterium]
MSHAVEVFHLSKSFQGNPAVKDISFTVDKGEVVGLVGPNGAGKSVTMRMLAGLIVPDSGQFALNGNLDPFSSSVLPSVSYLSQTQDFPKDTSLESLMGLCRHLSPEWDFELEAELLKRFPLPAKAQASQCSVGQKLQISLVCALSQRSDVILLDEPGGNLDPLARSTLNTALALAMDSYKPAVLIATHLLQSLERLVDRVLFISKGRLIHSLGADELSENYRRVSISFPSEVPAEFSLQDAIGAAVDGRTYTAILRCAIPEQLHSTCSAYGAKWTLFPVSLEQLFIELNKSEDAAT